MAKRFGRRIADGIYEYHDSRESLIEAERQESSEFRAFLFGFVGLLVGGIFAYLALRTYAQEWPKWLRFSVVIAGSGAAAYVLAKLADFVWTVILICLLVALMWGLGSLLWRVV